MMKKEYYVLQFTMLVDKQDVDMVENELLNQLRKEKAVYDVNVFKHFWG